MIFLGVVWFEMGRKEETLAMAFQVKKSKTIGQLPLLIFTSRRVKKLTFDHFESFKHWQNA